jgi:hypothetical protein
MKDNKIEKINILPMDDVKRQAIFYNHKHANFKLRRFNLTTEYSYTNITINNFTSLLDFNVLDEVIIKVVKVILFHLLNSYHSHYVILDYSINYNSIDLFDVNTFTCYFVHNDKNIKTLEKIKSKISKIENKYNLDPNFNFVLINIKDIPKDINEMIMYIKDLLVFGDNPLRETYSYSNDPPPFGRGW